MLSSYLVFAWVCTKRGCDLGAQRRRRDDCSRVNRGFTEHDPRAARLLGIFVELLGRVDRPDILRLPVPARGWPLCRLLIRRSIPQLAVGVTILEQGCELQALLSALSCISVRTVVTELLYPKCDVTPPPISKEETKLRIPADPN
jgi:hypothetical protein